MKKVLMFIMFLLTFSGAQAVDSGGNSVYINQTAATNSITSITQTGSGNAVGDRTNLITPAFLIDGNAMTTTIVQDGMNNSIVGNFIGGDSTTTVTQTGSGNDLVLTQGNFGTNGGLLTVTNTGDNNVVTLNMATTHMSNSYKYILAAVGSTNAVTSTLNSKYIDNNITLTGSNNTYTTIQNGAHGTALLPGHKIVSTIIGSSNVVSITQNGTTTPNIVTLNVTGSGTTTTIIQH